MSGTSIRNYKRIPPTLDACVCAQKDVKVLMFRHVFGEN